MRHHKVIAQFIIVYISITVIFCLMITISIKDIFCFEQDKKATQQDIALGQGITVNVDRVRTWKIFDGDFPSKLLYEHWISNNVTIRDYHLLREPKIAAKATFGLKGQSIFSMIFENFAPDTTLYHGWGWPKETKTTLEESGEEVYSKVYENFNPSDFKEGIRPSGKFLELLLWFTNAGKKESVVWFNTKDENLMDSHLILNSQTIYAKAFLIPGLEIAYISLVTAWEGQLGFVLKQGEQTWLLLIFDIPEEHKSIQFQLKDASPVSIKVLDSE